MLTEVREARWRAGAEAVASAPGGVAVTRLGLTNFRNYRGERLALGGGPVVLTGANGAGKTNLLEALVSRSRQGLARREIERGRSPPHRAGWHRQRGLHGARLGGRGLGCF